MLTVVVSLSWCPPAEYLVMNMVRILYTVHVCTQDTHVSPCELVMAGQGWSVISGECEVGREAEHAEI